jgi:acyl-CoA dehydrogenase
VRLSLDEEQEMVKESVRGCLRSIDDEAIRSVWGRDYLRAPYGELSRLGMLELALDEGSWDTAVEATVVAEALGSRGLVTPFFASVAWAGGIVSCSPSSQALRQELESVALGGAVWTFAAYGEGTRDCRPATPVRLDGNLEHPVLTCTLRKVEFATNADAIVVPCRVDDTPLVIKVPLSRPGIAVERTRVGGGSTFGSVSFKGVLIEPEDVVARGPDVYKLLERSWAKVLLLQAAYLVGSASAMFGLTRDHVLARVQFGRPLSAFQAVRHHLADSYRQLEGARLMVYQSAWLAKAGVELALMAETKAWVSTVALDVARYGHELHGGVGALEESAAALLSQRIIAEAVTYGSASQLWPIASGLAAAEYGVPR